MSVWSAILIEAAREEKRYRLGKRGNEGKGFVEGWTRETSCSNLYGAIYKTI